MIWNFELPLLLQGKVFPKIKQFCWYDLEIWTAPIITSSKYPRFTEVTRIFELPRLSRGSIFAKIRQFCWCDLEICPAPIIKSWSFWKKWRSFDEATWKFKLSRLSRGKHPSKIWQKIYEVSWKFALPLLWPGKIFPKVKQFSWCDLKICTAPIIKSWSFCKK